MKSTEMHADEEREALGSREVDDALRRGGLSLTVKRARLLHDLASHGRETGLCFICAPEGFGKTTLLLQYAAEVRRDPSRGGVLLVDGASLDGEGIMGFLGKVAETLDARMHPLAIIDNVPSLPPVAVELIAKRLRALRERGYEFACACKPSEGELMGALGDSFKIGAQALAVRPQEYPEWAAMFSIAPSLDVYELTQGIPSLVALLQTVSGTRGGAAALGRGIARLYRSVLDDLRRSRDSLFRLACLFFFVGEGGVCDLERCGMRVRAEGLSRMAHDYPMFGLDAERRTFRCLGTGGSSMGHLKQELAARRPAFALTAARILMGGRRVDRAVRLMERLLDTTASLEIIDQYPVAFALSGNAGFVNGVVARLQGEDALNVSTGVLLSVYLCGLVTGEYRIARSMVAELRRRAHDIEREIAGDAWGVAVALSEVWGSCTGMALPEVTFAHGGRSDSSEAKMLRAHRAFYADLMRSGQAPCPHIEGGPREGNAVDVTRVLVRCDELLDRSLHGDIADALEVDGELQKLATVLLDRHLVPLASRVRMTAATCRLMAGLPVVDERAFVDAGNTAVRESDLPTQLFCLVGEGWQAFGVEQLVNARFRGQQVEKLAEKPLSFLCAWAHLLERVSYIQNAAQVMIRGEAELLDLSHDDCLAAEAWATALHLSAARYDAELSAWYSVHKATMLDERFRPLARQALAAIGDRANSLRRLLPSRLAEGYLLGNSEREHRERTFDIRAVADYAAQVGQVTISLFGGFKVERNGHTLTDEVWKRKKAGILAARLVLASGSFVSRRVITEEMWPKMDYAHARENLYVTLSALRRAFGQRQDSPQYVLTQGDGVALNGEFVVSDIERFDMLARDVLLRRSNTSARHVVESCLKLEELYTGALYVPDLGETMFYDRMRRAYLNKFVDCMLRGTAAALEAEDTASASWLIEAAMRQASMREDVIRAAMRVYDACGRRREIVELYHGHLHYLEHELKMAPEDETRLAYESIIGKARVAAMM